MSNSGGPADNYHSSQQQQQQQRHYFAASPDNRDVRGQQHQEANPPLTTMTAANGLPIPSKHHPSKTTTAQHLDAQLAGLSQHHQQQQQVRLQNSNNNNNILHNHHQTKGCPESLPSSQQQQQQKQALRHFGHGPIGESVTMHRANMNNSHRRQDPSLIGKDQQQQQQQQRQQLSMPSRRFAGDDGGEAHNFNTSTAGQRLATRGGHYLDGAALDPPHEHQHHQLAANNAAIRQQDPQHQQHQHHHHHYQNHTAHHLHQRTSGNDVHQQLAKQAPPPGQQPGRMTDCPCDRGGHEDGLGSDHYFQHQSQQDQHYANQLRRSQLQVRVGQQSAPGGFHRPVPPPPPLVQATTPTTAPRQQQQMQQRRQTSGGGPSSEARNTQQAAAGREALHVNFNRSSQRGANEPDEDESGESTRKKKYLTAKYGQQQMNLIKKRLKIEMWLHDQLQELAKKSKTVEQDELDEIDIDLDQLLDMDDEPDRRHWLRKTLQPLSDLPNDAIEQFISDVIEQSKLL